MRFQSTSSHSDVEFSASVVTKLDESIVFATVERRTFI